MLTKVTSYSRLWLWYHPCQAPLGMHPERSPRTSQEVRQDHPEVWEVLQEYPESRSFRTVHEISKTSWSSQPLCTELVPRSQASSHRSTQVKLQPHDKNQDEADKLTYIKQGPYGQSFLQRAPPRAYKNRQQKLCSGTTKKTREAIRQAHRLSSGGRPLEGWIIKELLLEEFWAPLSLIFFGHCFNTGLKSMSTFECTQQIAGNKYAHNIHAMACPMRAIGFVCGKQYLMVNSMSRLQSSS